MRTLLAILLAISSSVFAAGSDDLIGNWSSFRGKLLSKMSRRRTSLDRTQKAT
jgi:hypothetical protein